MIEVALAGYTVALGEQMPDEDDPDCAHAALVERFDVAAATEQRHGSAPNEVHIEVRRDALWPAWPVLCVGQRYHRKGGGDPGILLASETSLFFIGAGERLVAYDLHGPSRLWEDHADIGFHSWQRHDDLVVMAAELELAAWDVHGVKRWSTFVEPPWSYRVVGNLVRLDVMGISSTFPLASGPVRF
jgi:hypothetical protein